MAALGIAVAGMLIFVAAIVAAEKTVTDDRQSGAAAVTTSAHEHAEEDVNVALPLASFAGQVPENADELAKAHEPYDASLPPLQPGELVKVTMTLKDMVVEVAPG